jgi:hypothetical protein
MFHFLRATVTMLFFAFMLFSVQASAQVSEFDVREKLDEHIHLLEAAVQYIRQVNPDALRKIDDDFESALSFFAEWQQSRQNIARGIRVRTASDDEINRFALKFQETILDAESARMEVSIRWPLFLETQQEADQFARQMNHLIALHQTMFEAANKMYSNRSAVRLPMMADVYGPDQIDIPAGQQYKTEYLVENIGTVPLNEIELQVETIAKEKVQSIWIEPDRIASISPGKAVKVHLYIESEYSGQDLVQLRIESNEISKTQILRITQ